MTAALQVPNPGSPEAARRGCLCPRVENHHGAGFPGRDGPEWWTRVDCPLHGDPVMPTTPRPTSIGDQE